MCKAGLFAGRLDVLQVAITAWKRWSMTFTFGDWMPWYDSKLSSSTLVKNHKTFLLCLLAVGTHFVLRHLGNRSPVMVGVERARAVLSTAGIDDRATWMTERVDIVDALADHNVSPAKHVRMTVGVRAYPTHGRNSQERDGASSNEEGRKTADDHLPKRYNSRGSTHKRTWTEWWQRSFRCQSAQMGTWRASWTWMASSSSLPSSYPSSSSAPFP